MNSGWVQKGVIVKWQHTFDIDRYVHCLDSGSGFKGVCVCQSSSNPLKYLKCVQFIVSQLLIFVVVVV